MTADHTARYQQLDAWVNEHFDEEVRLLQALVRVPTDTPPGDNAPHAERTAALLAEMGLPSQLYPVPPELVLVNSRIAVDTPAYGLNAPPGSETTASSF